MKTRPANFQAPRARLFADAILVCFFAATLAGSIGCQTVKPVDYARSYPVKLPPGPTLDVQVFRRTSTLDFTNTTAAPLGPGTIWLNRWFSRPLPKAIGVGESVSIPLIEFRDEFGDPFRPGGFFATEAPSALVLCQIEVPREGQEPEIIGLVTVQSFGDE